MNIRSADSEEDARQVASLGLKFIGKLKMNTQPDFDRVLTSVQSVLVDPMGVVLVAEDKPGQICGFLVGMAVPLWFDSLDWSAVELAWWLDPDKRGGRTAIRLVQAFEQWAGKRGVHRIVLSDVEFEDRAQPAGALIERLGYTLHERAFVKKL